MGQRNSKKTETSKKTEKEITVEREKRLIGIAKPITEKQEKIIANQQVKSLCQIITNELKACGFNKDAAKYAGINEKRNIVLSMTISGALAGIGAGLYYLSGGSEWNPQVATALPAIGFNGIPVALLALSNPIGVVFAAIFVAHISVGGAYLPTKYFQPEIADFIVAVIIYLCAFVMLFKGIVTNMIQKKKQKAEHAGKEEK